MGKIDLTSQQFGRLHVLGLDEEKSKEQKRSCWKCKCSCGNETVVAGNNLTRKKYAIVSCGCLNADNHRGRQKFNTFEEFEDYYLVWDTKHQNSFTISKEDYISIKEYCWCKTVKGYWISDQRHRGLGMLKLHQFILSQMVGEYDKRLYVPDHIDRDRSNNKRDNLRLATYSENARNLSLGSKNSSGKLGVKRKGDKWVAQIDVNGKRINLGTFVRLEEAIEARVESEKEYGFIGE